MSSNWFIGSHPWIPNLDEKTIREMLEKIGVKKIEDLFSDIPSNLKIDKILDVGFKEPLSEMELEHIALQDSKGVKDSSEFLVFTGGVCKHFIPYVIDVLVKRAEFYTSYTPYQPEISQGILQALFEYQSLMADLLEMDVVNASMYDGSTALAEAMLTSLRLTKKKKILVPSTMNPEYYEVMKTYLGPHSINIVKVNYDSDTSLLDLNDLDKKIDSGTAAVYIENPTFLGFIESQIDEISEIAHRNNALFIVGVDPISLGILRPPGDYDADIVIGEAQPLGIGLNYGGSYLGIFAVRDDYKIVRQMPGRIIGMTTSIDGKETGFTMILQTREQHIRREKATSNICTNEALCALRVAIYLSLVGSEGLKNIGLKILRNSHYALDKIRKIEGIDAPIFSSSFFKGFPVKFKKKDVETINRELFKRGILGGLPIDKDFLGIQNLSLYCFTEILSFKDIDFLVEKLTEVIRD